MMDLIALQQTVTNRQARLVAVSKTYPPDQILAVYATGQRLFGENKVQELVAKYEALPKDIEWHMIGHLQRNKVKYIAPFVAMIHGVDSYELLAEIDKQGRKNGRPIPCLLQFHIAEEETKFGFDPDEAVDMLTQMPWQTLEYAQICGVMGMATFTEDTQRIRTEFRHLRAVFTQLKQRFFPDSPHFKEVSMGMSGDWEIALEEGASLVRIGSLIFGQRTYPAKQNPTDHTTSTTP